MPQKTNYTHEIPILGDSRSKYVVYGKEFKYSQRGQPDHKESKDAAFAAAEAHGREYQAILTKRAGRPITHREAVTGRLPVAPAPKEFKRAGSPEPNPNVNPYTAVIQELRDRPGHTPKERAFSEKRVLRYEHLSAEWDAKRAATVAKETRDSDESVQRMRADALQKYEQARLNPAWTQEEIDGFEKRYRETQNDTLTPQQYWGLHGSPESKAALVKAVTPPDGASDE